jgi:hypothetical protein
MKAKASIKGAYQMLYSDDELGYQLNDVTFEDVFRTLDNYGSVYKLIGVYDSIVRERIFSMLAVIMDVEYDYIYDQWLACKEG